jgi:hypothetical protein
MMSRLAAICLLVSLTTPAAALDRIVLKRDAGDISLAGRIYGEAADGRCLLQTPEGVLWPIEAKERASVLHDDEPFVAVRAEQQAKRMLERLPAGFDVYRTKHFVVCYNGSKAYATWCGGLYSGFTPALSTSGPEKA